MDYGTCFIQKDIRIEKDGCKWKIGKLALKCRGNGGQILSINLMIFNCVRSTGCVASRILYINWIFYSCDIKSRWHLPHLQRFVLFAFCAVKISKLSCYCGPIFLWVVHFLNLSHNDSFSGDSSLCLVCACKDINIVI